VTDCRRSRVRKFDVAEASQGGYRTSSEPDRVPGRSLGAAALRTTQGLSRFARLQAFSTLDAVHICLAIGTVRVLRSCTRGPA
jgi:hypothetical protein